MFVFWLILCSSEIVSRHLVAKNEITGFWVAKLQNSDVEECDLTLNFLEKQQCMDSLIKLLIFLQFVYNGGCR